jgi:hypothetical protein
LKIEELRYASGGSILKNDHKHDEATRDASACAERAIFYDKNYLK